jgi:hypothetical protein
MLLDLAFFGTPPAMTHLVSVCPIATMGSEDISWRASSLAYDELKKNVWFFEIQKADI